MMVDTDLETGSKRHILRAANLSQLRDRSLYPLIVHFCLALVPIILAVYGFALFERTHKSPAQFYAIHGDQAIRMVALRRPNLTTEALLQWATQAASACYTFDFYNYRTVIKDVRPYFTENGYQSFLNALDRAKVTQDVFQKKLVVSAVPTDTPIVLGEGETPDGGYLWRVQFPMLITYVSASENIKQNIFLTLLITRVPTTESIKGIGISSFVVRETTLRL